MTLEIVDCGWLGEELRCPHCGAVLSPSAADADPFNEWSPSPACEHVFMIGNDVAVEFLSPLAQQALAKAGLRVKEQEPGLWVVDGPDNREELTVGVVANGVDMAGAQVLSVYAPGPSFLGTYFGVAPEVSE